MRIYRQGCYEKICTGIHLSISFDIEATFPPEIGPTPRGDFLHNKKGQTLIGKSAATSEGVERASVARKK